MDCLVANIGGRIRRDSLNGRPHIVAPVTMVVPGVLAGSRGPLYYPQNELAKSVSSWNHVPLVVYHPKSNGIHVSARDPDILNSQGVGVVLRAKVNGKLTAEAWFDIEKTRKVDNRVLEALEQGKKIELSTGLDLEIEHTEDGATHNGKPYLGIAKNYRPDHLAILPDQVGACSIDDGCGVLANNVTVNTVGQFLSHINRRHDMPLTKERREELVTNIVTNCDCWEEKDRDTLNGFSDSQLSSIAAPVDNASRTHTSESKSTSTETVNLTDIATDDLEDEIKNRKKEMKEKMKEDEVSNNTKIAPEDWLRAAPDEIKKTFEHAYQVEQREKDTIIEQLTANLSGVDKRAQQERLRKRSIDDLKDDLLLVPKSTTNTSSDDSSDEKVEKNDWIANMLNRVSYTSEDDPLIPPTIDWAANTVDEKVQEPSTPNPQNSRDWLKNAPHNVRNILENAIQIERREREAIIERIAANVNDREARLRVKDRLSEKSLEELKDLEALGALNDKPKSSYLGASTPPPVANLSDDERDDILPLPTMNYEAKQA